MPYGDSVFIHCARHSVGFFNPETHLSAKVFLNYFFASFSLLHFLFSYHLDVFPKWLMIFDSMLIYKNEVQSGDCKLCGHGLTCCPILSVRLSLVFFSWANQISQRRVLTHVRYLGCGSCCWQFILFFWGGGVLQWKSGCFSDFSSIFWFHFLRVF